MKDLEIFRIEATAEMEKILCEDWFSPSTELDCSVLWSKSPCYSIVPFELEMSGLAPAKIIKKEPQSKKNAHKLYFLEGRIIRIDSFDANGKWHEVERFIYQGGRCISLCVDKHGEKKWLKMSDSEDGKTLMAGRVDLDSEYWTYQYKWTGSRISEIISKCSNSEPGTIIYVEYDDQEKLNHLYFINKGVRVNVF